MIFSVRNTRNENANLVFEDGICQLGSHNADAPAGVALELDDLVRCVDDLVVDVAPVLRVSLRVFAGRRAHVSKPRASDVHVAPDWDTRVAVLAHDVAAPAPHVSKQVIICYTVVDQI